MNGKPVLVDNTLPRSVIQKQNVMIMIKPVVPFKSIEHNIDLGKTQDASLISSAALSQIDGIQD